MNTGDIQMIALSLPSVLTIIGMVGALVLWGFRTLNKYNDTNLGTQTALVELNTTLQGIDKTVTDHHNSLGKIFDTQKKDGEDLTALVATCKQTHKRCPIS